MGKRRGVRDQPAPEPWRVDHPRLGFADVMANSPEAAVKDACEKEWGVSWGLFGGECRAHRLRPAEKRRCVRCGGEVNDSGERMCVSCRNIAASEKREHFKHYPIRRERA